MRRSMRAASSRARFSPKALGPSSAPEAAEEDLGAAILAGLRGRGPGAFAQFGSVHLGNTVVEGLLLISLDRTQRKTYIYI